MILKSNFRSSIILVMLLLRSLSESQVYIHYIKMGEIRISASAARKQFDIHAILVGESFQDTDALFLLVAAIPRLNHRYK